MSSGNDFLMSGGGAKSAKFPTVGSSITGTVASDPEVVQQTEFGTGKPLFWDDGKPRQQLVVQLNTNLREDAEDDGVRAIYVKGKSLTGAIREAVKLAGAPGLEIGGTLTVTYVGDGKAERGMPPKLYTAAYQRPTNTAANAFLADTTPSAPPAAPVAVQAGPADMAALLASLPPEQRAALLAQAGQQAAPPF